MYTICEVEAETTMGDVKPPIKARIEEPLQLISLPSPMALSGLEGNNGSPGVTQIKISVTSPPAASQGSDTRKKFGILKDPTVVSERASL